MSQQALKRNVAPPPPILATTLPDAAPFRRGIFMQQFFAEQAAATPEAVALVYEDEQWTYRELETRANQLAQRLRRLGVGPETLVGVFMEQAPELVVALYGVLKAGGAYVPLDPAYPRERLAQLLAETQAPVLLTQPQLQTRAAELAAGQTEVLCLTTEMLDAESAAPLPETGVNENNLSYVIFTSGSTGQPKGVMIEHRSICNHLQWFQARYPLTPADVVLLHTTFSFDYSLYEFFSTLLAGARLVIARADGVKDARYLAALMRRTGVTTLFLTPPLLQPLLEEKDFLECPTLRRVFSTGEPLLFALQQRFFARLPERVTLHNVYGPTEVTIEATSWDCERNSTAQLVPIGRLATNYQAYILDEHLQSVPDGEVGELHLGGIGLARGYLNKPELTAEKFIYRQRNEDKGIIAEKQTDYSSVFIPLSAEGERLYKTGDLARLRPDGVLECLGRMDYQVKIRGHRIELGEVEGALAQHPAVRQCAVVAREDQTGEKGLVAYFTAHDAAAPPAGRKLRQFLSEKLPDYMLPGAFVALPEFPLTPSGKINRRNLPAPVYVAPENDFVAPQDEVERWLVAVWERELGVQPISVTADFFDLGGHSLRALRIFAEIEQRYGRKLALAVLLQAPTVRELAALLRQPATESAAEQMTRSALVEIQPQGARLPFFCVHGAGANVLHLRLLAQSLDAEQPFYGLQALGLNGQQAPLTRIEEMAVRYLSELRTVQPHGPYCLGGFSMGGMVAFEMAQQLLAAGEQIALLALIDSYYPQLPEHQAPRTRFQTRVYPVLYKIESQLESWRRLGGGQYLRRKTAGLKQRMQQGFTKLGRQFAEPLAEVTEPLPDALLQVWLANLEAAQKYVPQPYPGRLTLFWSSDEDLRAQDTRLGWSNIAAQGLEVHLVPGTHMSLREAPHINVLAAKLNTCLVRAQSPHN